MLLFPSNQVGTGALAIAVIKHSIEFALWRRCIDRMCTEQTTPGVSTVDNTLNFRKEGGEHLQLNQKAKALPGCWGVEFSNSDRRRLKTSGAPPDEQRHIRKNRESKEYDQTIPDTIRRKAI